MPSDFTPIYCRHCHKQIPPAVQVCPHCGEYQGLAQQAPPVTPPAMHSRTAVGVPPVPEMPIAAAGAQGTGPGASSCPHCLTLITPGDFFCRSCGRALVSGVRAAGSGDGAGKAYGISALLSAILLFPPGGIILGIIAIAKGSKALGWSALVISVITGIVTIVATLALGRTLLPHGLPTGALPTGQ